MAAVDREPLSCPALAALAGLAAVTATRPPPVVVVFAALTVVVVAGVAAARDPLASVRRALPMVVAAVAVVGVATSWRAASAAAGLAPDRLGAYEGWVRLVDDPQRLDGATRVIVEIDGERFETWIRGRARRIRADGWRGGELVEMSGRRVALADERAERVAWQHVVGRFDLEWAGDVVVGSGVDRASNRIRGLVEHAGATLPGHDGALFRGLVIGDDRDQPIAMIDRFRRSGLSHLTAVSGQNVSFVIAAVGPVLVRLRTWPRWAATVLLVAWFVSLTRFEPSILRAGTMAAWSATAHALGRPRPPTRTLSTAVLLLVLVDPLLVRSVGFWLSVGATGGVTTIGPWLAARLGPLGRLATPVGITLGAQVGVLVPALVVFGRLPLVSVPANLLAVPVAGFVMFYGLPAGLVAGLSADVAPVVATIVMLPCRVGVRWVDTVATVAAGLEPSGAAVWWGWALIVAAVGLIAAKSGGHHGRASADGRRRIGPEGAGARRGPRVDRSG
jgi:competence protein ComEC